MNWFKNLSAFKKLITGFGLVCVIMGGVGYIGVSRTARVNDMLNSMYENELLGISRCKEANVRLVSIRSTMRNVLIQEDAAEKQRASDRLEVLAKEFSTLIEESRSNFTTSEGITLLKRVEETFPEYLQGARDAVNKSVNGDKAAAVASMQSAAGAADRLDSDLSELARLKESIAAAYATSDEVYQAARTTILCVSIFGVICGLAIGTFITRLFSVPLHETVSALKKIALGDFTVRVDVQTKDETAQSAVSPRKTTSSPRIQATPKVAKPSHNDFNFDDKNEGELASAGASSRGGFEEY